MKGTLIETRHKYFDVHMKELQKEMKFVIEEYTEQLKKP
jgi:hypothetical protein